MGGDTDYYMILTSCSSYRAVWILTKEFFRGTWNKRRAVGRLAISVSGGDPPKQCSQLGKASSRSGTAAVVDGIVINACSRTSLIHTAVYYRRRIMYWNGCWHYVER